LIPNTTIIRNYPLVAQALGAGNPVRARQMLWQSVYLAALVTAALLAPLFLSPLILVPLGIEQPVADVVRSYLWIRIIGLFPALVYVGARSYLQGVGVTRPLVISTIAANIVNFALDVLLVFGGAGLPAWMGPVRSIPALGTDGAAWATATATLCQLAILIVAVRGTSVPGGDPSMIRTLDRSAIAEALKVGAPVGFQLAAETGVFALAGFLAGRMGAHALAAHQIALTLASMTFMVAVGLGNAGSVRVGKAIGARDVPGTRRAGLVAFAAAGGFMTFSALMFWAFPRQITLLLTDKEDLILSAIPLMTVAAAFQISDGLQAVGSGVLRGAGDTTFAFLANVAGHWLVGLPVALIFGVWLGYGVVGLWIGLATGLSAVAAALFARFYVRSRRAIAPLESFTSSSSARPSSDPS
ncbi:MAG: MATE family efflux transporter, partial [Myxococcaceae bacterium]